MEGTNAGFSKAVCFVEGTKLPAWTRHDKQDQIEKYDGHHHMNCLASLD